MTEFGLGLQRSVSRIWWLRFYTPAIVGVLLAVIIYLLVVSWRPDLQKSGWLVLGVAAVGAVVTFLLAQFNAFAWREELEELRLQVSQNPTAWREVLTQVGGHDLANELREIGAL